MEAILSVLLYILQDIINGGNHVFVEMPLEQLVFRFVKSKSEVLTYNNKLWHMLDTIL